MFSSQFTIPIVSLINAAEKIKNGNLSTRAKIDNSISPEIKLLSITFNDMVSTIQDQQIEQQNTNDQLDEKISYNFNYYDSFDVNIFPYYNGRYLSTLKFTYYGTEECLERPYPRIQREISSCPVS